MTEMEKEINTIIMQEIGLEVGKNNIICDQDTGDALKINGMDIVAPGCYGGKQSIEFDPYNNRKMMGQLFGHFLGKYSDETGVDVLSYYNVDSGVDMKVECRMSNDSIVSSKSYGRDSLKYTDIIMQLNGGEADLSKYDIPQTKETIRRKK